MAFRGLLFGSGCFEESGALGQSDPATPADEQVIQRHDMAVLDRAITRLPAPLKEALQPSGL